MLQEDFLKSVCRGVYQGPVEGVHTCGDEALEQLVAKAWSTAHVNAGPVHLNLPFEEPLYADQLEQSKLLSEWEPQLQKRAVFFSGSKKSLLVTMNDLSPDCQMNFSKLSVNASIRNSFHVYPTASVGYLHLHSYLDEFLTTAHDTMEKEAKEKGYIKNTSFEEVMESL